MTQNVEDLAQRLLNMKLKNCYRRHKGKGEPAKLLVQRTCDQDQGDSCSATGIRRSRSTLVVSHGSGRGVEHSRSNLG